MAAQRFDDLDLLFNRQAVEHRDHKVEDLLVGEYTLAVLRADRNRMSRSGGRCRDGMLLVQW